jgi:hypothetical protein
LALRTGISSAAIEIAAAALLHFIDWSQARNGRPSPNQVKRFVLKVVGFATMKIRLLLLAVALAVIGTLSVTFAQSKRSRATKEFMRDKLDLSQRVLEGLATEDYDLIIAKGTRLSAMSKAADWHVFENPDYEQQSTIFRWHVDSLVKAAKNKNLDAATLAYVRMTMSCVDCHKLVRGKLVASTGGAHGTALGGVPEAGFARHHRLQNMANAREAQTQKRASLNQSAESHAMQGVRVLLNER